MSKKREKIMKKTREEEFKRKEVEIERKEREEIVVSEVEIPHSTLLCKDIKIKLLK